MRRLLGAVWLLLLCAATGLAQQPPPRTPEKPAQADAAELVNALLGSLMGDGAVDGPTLQKEVEDAGGIRFKRDVPVDFLDRAHLVTYLRDLFDAEYTPEQARADERLLRAFDLLPPGTDLRALRARVLEENVAGFYDERPGKRRLYAVSEDRSFTPMNQIVLAHEMRHALQDQYADLHELLGDGVGDFDDRRIAATALFEGDATLVMERFLRQRLGGLGTLAAEDAGDDTSTAALAMPSLFDLPGAPPVVRDHLIQPYLAGLSFARALWKRGGADAMRGAWGHPPESTEQVLHPALFFAGQRPRAVALRVPAPPGASLVAEGVLGELLIRTLLDEAEVGGTAWSGDGWRLWDVRGRTALAWRSEWDTSAAAVAFEGALRQRFVRHHGAAAARDGWQVFAADPTSFGLRRDGDAVELVSADDPQVFASLLRPRTAAGDAATDDGTLDFGGRIATVPSTAQDAEEMSAEPPASRDPAQGGVMATSTPPGNQQTNLGMAPNMAGLLCYVPCCIGLIFSVVAAIVEKQSKFVRFHAFQSLLLHAVAIVIGIALQILHGLLAVAGLGVVGLLLSLVGLVVGLGFLGVTIFMMIKANGGEEIELPVIGPMARNWA